MRMTTDHSGNERGAVLVIVAISMVAILGMIVLVVDVGGLLVSKRRVVTGTDSATLAAAQTCAMNLGPDEATSEADDLAESNIDGAIRIGPLRYGSIGCDGSLGSVGGGVSGSVTGRYRKRQRLFFAPILGFGEQLSVPATARAIWAPAGGTTPVPLDMSLSSADLLPCVEEDIDSPCAYWYDNGGGPFTNSSKWGYMNLGLWPETDLENQPIGVCPSSEATPRDLSDWIQGIKTVEVKLRAVPTFVCAVPGNRTPGWEALESQLGKVKAFPINDPDQMVIAANGNFTKYAIIGFAQLKLEKLCYIEQNGTRTCNPEGDEATYVGSPGTDPVDPEEKNCPGWPQSHTFRPAPLNTKIMATDILACAALILPDSGQVIEPPTIKNATLGEDYNWDPVLKIITWIGNFPGGRKTVDIELKWLDPGEPGIEETFGQCGPPPSGGGNSRCLITRFVGSELFGTEPDPDLRDFGLRATRLVD